jgi:hypothetical protein
MIADELSNAKVKTLQPEPSLTATRLASITFQKGSSGRSRGAIVKAFA